MAAYDDLSQVLHTQECVRHKHSFSQESTLGPDERLYS